MRYFIGISLLIIISIINFVNGYSLYKQKKWISVKDSLIEYRIIRLGRMAVDAYNEKRKNPNTLFFERVLSAEKNRKLQGKGKKMRLSVLATLYNKKNKKHKPSCAKLRAYFTVNKHGEKILSKVRLTPYWNNPQKCAKLRNKFVPVPYKKPPKIYKI